MQKIIQLNTFHFAFIILTSIVQDGDQEDVEAISNSSKTKTKSHHLIASMPDRGHFTELKVQDFHPENVIAA